MASENDPPGRIRTGIGRLARRLTRTAPRTRRGHPPQTGAEAPTAAPDHGRPADGTAPGSHEHTPVPPETAAADSGAADTAESGSRSSASDIPGADSGAAAAGSAGADADADPGPDSAAPDGAADTSGSVSAPLGHGRRLKRLLLRTGAKDRPARLRPTPLGLFGVAVAAMFVTLLLIQTAMGTFRTSGPEGTDDSGGALAPVASPPSGTARIMIAGDSIAQGSSGDYTWRYRLWKHLSKRSDLDVEFVGPYDTMLNVVTGDPGATSYAVADFDTDHASRWGATAADIARDVGEQVAEYDPHYLLFMAGTNDFAHGRSVEDALSAVRDAVTTARVAQGGIRVVLGEVTPVWGSGADEDMNTRIATFNAALPELARQMSGERSPVTVAHTAKGYAPAQDTWDGTHPNARGELKIAAAFADVLARKLSLGDPYKRPLPDVRTGPRQAPEVAAEEEAGGVRLTWKQVPGATRYQVLQQRVRPDPDEQVRLPMQVSVSRADQRPSAVVDHLLAGATYEFVVQPFKGDDGGARSEPVRITPADDPPPAPEWVRPGPDGGTLTWADVPSATHYEVWRRPLHCTLPEPPDPPEQSPSPEAGEGSAAPPGSGEGPAATAPPAPTGEPEPTCEPRDGRGPQQGQGWQSAAIVNGETRWSIPDDGTTGWEYSVRAHRDFVRGGYSAPVTVKAPG